MNYAPDKFVVIKILHNNETIYKVFGMWSGGYLSGDSWRMNSGIESIKIIGDKVLFMGYSGSVYEVYKQSESVTAYGGAVLSNIIDKSNGVAEVIDLDELINSGDVEVIYEG